MDQGNMMILKSQISAIMIQNLKMKKRNSIKK